MKQLRKHSLVTRTLAGCKKMLNTAPTRKSALAPHHLFLLLEHFPPDSHDNRLFRALLLSGFFALHRLGELVWPDDVDLRSWRKVIPRSSMSLQEHAYSYVLPGHKADRLFHGSQVVVDDTFAPQGLSPTGVLREYLCSRDALFLLQPALWLTATGSVPARRWFLSRLRSVIADPHISGHSLRAGGATYFAGLGWPDDRIQALGRWSSDAFRVYIREHPVVMQALLHWRTTRL